MHCELWSIPEASNDLYDDFVEWLARREVGSATSLSGARRFLRRFPDPQAFAGQELSARLAEVSQVRPMLNFLMLHGHLRPGYDYLLERRVTRILKEAARSSFAQDLAIFLGALAPSATQHR